MNKKFKKIPLMRIGGLNNSNYLVKIQDEKYVLRIPSKDNKNNFHNENQILYLIKPLNISPEIIYHNKDNGILLSKYIESTTYDIFKSILSSKISNIKVPNTIQKRW